MEQLETMNNNVLIRQKHGDIKIQILDHNRPEAALRVSFLLCALPVQGGDGVGHPGGVPDLKLISLPFQVLT